MVSSPGLRVFEWDWHAPPVTPFCPDGDMPEVGERVVVLDVTWEFGIIAEVTEHLTPRMFGVRELEFHYAEDGEFNV